MTYLVLVGAHAEVLECLTGVLGAAEQQGVASGRRTQSQLIQRQALTASGDDASASGGSEAQGSDRDLGDLEKAVVVGDGADDNDGLVGLVATGDLRLDARERNRGSVDARHKQAAQDDLYRFQALEGHILMVNWNFEGSRTSKRDEMAYFVEI